jgi:excisionase family DNA binding protein
MNVVERDVVTPPSAMHLPQMIAMALPSQKPVQFEPLISAVDAGQLLDIHPVTLLRWAREGRVPHRRLGRRVVFRVSELDRWLNSPQSTTGVGHAA